MTDAARAEITNAIWLCKNCHKIIDSDDSQFTSGILFAWRAEHDKYILSELGTQSERIQYEQQQSKIVILKEYPPIIQRIAIDQPKGWE